MKIINDYIISYLINIIIILHLAKEFKERARNWNVINFANKKLIILWKFIIVNAFISNWFN